MATRSEVNENIIPTVDKHTASFKIFNYNFMCVVKQMHLYTEEYLNVFGMATSGDPLIDRGMANADTQVMFHIVDMAEFHHDGKSVRLVNPADSLTIYNIIREHLFDWQKRIKNDFHTTDAPIDDLRKLDNFAADLYPIAVNYMPKDNTPMGRFFDVINSITENRAGMGRNMPSSDKTDNPSARPKKHTPMADGLAAELKERKRSWQ